MIKYFSLSGIKKAAAFALTAGFYIIFFAFRDGLSAPVQNAMYIIYHSLLPSVFPFMVLSGILTNGGFFSKEDKIMSLLGKAFNIPAAAAFIIPLGILSGFPCAAVSAGIMYKNGMISKDEGERIIAVCSLPSPSFSVFYVGGCLLRDEKTGMALFLTDAVTALLFGLALGRISGKRKNSKQVKMSLHEDTVRQTGIKNDRETGGFLPVLSESISNAGASFVRVSAFVMFFSILTGLVNNALPLGEISNALLCGFLELSCGCRAAAELCRAEACKNIIFVIFSFSGISVLSQIKGLSGGLSVKYYLCGRILSLIIVPLVMNIFG